MREEVKAFLRAIAESPLGVQRLAFADWLEEQGDQNRAWCQRWLHANGKRPSETYGWFVSPLWGQEYSLEKCFFRKDIDFNYHHDTLGHCFDSIGPKESACHEAMVYCRSKHVPFGEAGPLSPDESYKARKPAAA